MRCGAEYARLRHTFGVIARLDRAIQYSETPVIESRGRGVLDSPLQCAIAYKAGNDSVTWRTQRRLTLRHYERSNLSAEAFGEGGSNPESFRGGNLDCFVARAPRNEEESASAKLSRAPDAAQRPPGDAKHRPVRRCAAEPGPIHLRRTMSPLGPGSAPQRPARCNLSGTTSEPHRFAWGCRRLTSGMPACRPEWMFCAFRKI